MYPAVSFEDEEKFDRRHETVIMLSLFKTISNSWVKRTVLLAFTFFLTFNINTTFAGQKCTTVVEQQLELPHQPNG